MARTVPVHTGYTIINGSGTGSNGNRIDVWAEYKLGTQSVEGNYTPFTIYFYAALNASYSSNTKYVGGLNSSCEVDGNAGTGVKAGDYDFTSSKTVNFLGSYSANIAHGDDGTKTVEFSCSFTTVSSYISGGNVSGEIVLDTIPRASSFGTITGTTLGGKMRVNISRNSTSFSHKVFYITGAGEDSEAFEGDTYVEFDLPLDLATQSPNFPTFYLALRLETYNGETKIGDNVTTEVSISIPDNEETKPTVALRDLMFVNDFAGRALQRRTRVTVEEEFFSAECKYGATDVNKYWKLEGKTYNFGDTSDPLIGTGLINVEVVAVDSRGFSNSYMYTISVQEYFLPILQAEAYRCLADGTADHAGEFLKIRASAEFASFTSMEENNSASFYYRYRAENAENYGDLKNFGEATVSGTVVESGALLDGDLSKENAYSVQIVVMDLVGEHIKATIPIPSERIYKHKKAGGKGLGLGGYCREDDLLDVYWNARIRKGLRVDGGIKLGDTPLLELVYPVGSIYMSTSEVNPQDLFGGSWE